jgi:hypothetical protein
MDPFDQGYKPPQGGTGLRPVVSPPRSPTLLLRGPSAPMSPIVGGLRHDDREGKERPPISTAAGRAITVTGTGVHPLTLAPRVARRVSAVSGMSPPRQPLAVAAGLWHGRDVLSVSGAPQPPPSPTHSLRALNRCYPQLPSLSFLSLLSTVNLFAWLPVPSHSSR